MWTLVLTCTIINYVSLQVANRWWGECIFFVECLLLNVPRSIIIFQISIPLQTPPTPCQPHVTYLPHGNVCHNKLKMTNPHTELLGYELNWSGNCWNSDISCVLLNDSKTPLTWSDTIILWYKFQYDNHSSLFTQMSRSYQC